MKEPERREIASAISFLGFPDLTSSSARCESPQAVKCVHEYDSLEFAGSTTVGSWPGRQQGVCLGVRRQGGFLGVQLVVLLLFLLFGVMLVFVVVVVCVLFFVFYVFWGGGGGSKGFPREHDS